MEWIAFIATLIIIFLSHWSQKSELEYKIKMLERDIDVLHSKINGVMEISNQKHEKLQEKTSEQLCEYSEKINYFSQKTLNTQRDLEKLEKEYKKLS
ncbi:MAG: hypothetical protein WC274_08045 [Sulfurimonas sp.]|jgi:t-SNARE complex subunit (syntaxin)